MRYFIELSYDGTPYHGWQRQPNAVTVQETIEHALSTLLRSPIAIVGAGRTDTGVHAKQLYAHFDWPEALEEQFVYRLNAFLGASIAVQHIFRVKDDAHARFDATSRTYEYWITTEKDPFLVDRAYYFGVPLNVEAMNEACGLLLGHQDFQCFSRSKTDVKTYYCDIELARWRRQGHLLIFTIQADRFLRNMVRAIVGTLLDIGLGKSNMKDLQAIIESKDRSQAGVSAPAHGLYLTKVAYKETILNNGRS